MTFSRDISKSFRILFDTSDVSLEQIGSESDIHAIIRETLDEDVILKIISNLSKDRFKNHLVGLISGSTFFPFFGAGWEIEQDTLRSSQMSIENPSIIGSSGVSKADPESLGFGDFFVDLMIFPPDELNLVSSEIDSEKFLVVIGEKARIDEHFVEILKTAANQISAIKNRTSLPKPPARISKQLLPEDNQPKTNETRVETTRTHLNSSNTESKSDSPPIETSTGPESFDSNIRKLLDNPPSQSKIKKGEVSSKKLLRQIRQKFVEVNRPRELRVAIELLYQYRDRASIPRLIEKLGEIEKASSREAINDTLSSLTFFPAQSLEAWVNWWQQNNDKTPKQWLLDSIRSSEKPRRELAEQQLDKLDIQIGYHSDISGPALEEMVERIDQELASSLASSSSIPID